MGPVTASSSIFELMSRAAFQTRPVWSKAIGMKSKDKSTTLKEPQRRRLGTIYSVATSEAVVGKDHINGTPRTIHTKDLLSLSGSASTLLMVYTGTFNSKALAT